MNILWNMFPGLNKWKTIIGSYAQMIAGILMAIVELIKTFVDCWNGSVTLDSCFQTLPMLFMGVVAAANGLATLGIGHKIEKQNASDPKMAAADQNGSVAPTV